jgi:hypothetical protein
MEDTVKVMEPEGKSGKTDEYYINCDGGNCKSHGT